jgi:cysteine synthase A
VTIVESTSGNTGIALALVAASRGYPLILTMPENSSVERRRLLRAFAAELVLTKDVWGMRGAIAQAEAIAASDPRRFWMPQQFSNPANPQAHFETTGPEIWEDTDGKVDILISGVGTGGTITGVSRYFKRERRSCLWSVAVEPAASPVLSAIKKGAPPRPGRHKLQGIGAGFKPPVLELDLVDEIQTVTHEEASEFAVRLRREEGLTVGFSGGAAAAVAARVAARALNAGKLVVVILPDGGDRQHTPALLQSIAV